jgi:hypothetical protein
MKTTDTQKLANEIDMDLCRLEAKILRMFSGCKETYETGCDLGIALRGISMARGRVRRYMSPSDVESTS